MDDPSNTAMTPPEKAKNANEPNYNHYKRHASRLTSSKRKSQPPIARALHSGKRT